MGTGVVITVAEKLFAVLHSQELRDVCSMFGYESQLDDLKLTVSTIKSVLLDAEAKHQELTHEGRDYIERLKEAVYHVDDLLDEFNTIVHRNKHIKGGNKVSKKVRRFFSRSNQLLVAYNMSHEIKNLRIKLDKIAKDRQQFGFSDVYVPVKRKQETMSFVGEDSIIGREDDREAIVKMLLGDSESSNSVDPKVSYVSIVGIGGLGKTALAQLVYNDKRVEKAFELRLWVCVSDEFVLEKIFRHMLGRDEFNIEGLQSQARNLIEGKRYLIVLDDVWSESRDEWDKLKWFLDLGGRGSRVVVTSRLKKVAKVVGSDLMHELKGLSDENSWNLFKNLAFEPGKEPMRTSDHLCDIGKEIVKKCANVPLAIRVTASMVFDQDERKWIALKKANLMEMGLGENGVMPILKYSYYHLTPALKSCFSLCALFPKDFRLEKKLLVRLWLAQGCLDQPHGCQNEEDVGDEYFSILLHRCFLQDVDTDMYCEITHCKMHDLIHDLAQEVSGKETMLLDSSTGLVDQQKIHLSFTKGGLPLFGSLTDQLSEMKTLRTFLRVAVGFSADVTESKVLAIFSQLKRLRVLDLHGLSFNILPDTIGSNLSHLRDLNLSGNKELTALPNSVTKLYNLQALNLDYTSVKELPLGMRKLVNLRHLSLLGCDGLTHMPPGLDTLTCLHTLSRFVVGKESSDGGNIGKLRDLSALVNLRGELDITWNSNSSCDVANYRQVELLSTAHLKKLSIQFRDQRADHETLLACLRPPTNLRRIEIGSYKGFRLPGWAASLASSLPNLVKISLINFGNLKVLPPLSKLRHLKYLTLQQYFYVEFMESDAAVGPSDEESQFFPSLEELNLYVLPKLKGWRREEISRVMIGEASSYSTAVLSFPCLNKLTICHCLSLKTFPSCPNLSTVDLYKCHKALTILPSSSSSSAIPLVHLDKANIDDNGMLDRLFKKSLGSIHTLCIHYFMGESFLISAENCAQYASSIKKLEITCCPNLKSVSGILKHFTCLQSLSISDCRNLELENNEEETTSSWESLHSLSELYLSGLPKLLNLPKELQYVTSLRSIMLMFCENLEAVPGWISCLTSLESLAFKCCGKLNSLPEAIGHMPMLQSLVIIRCGNLKSRCRKTDGEDWPKVRNIPCFAVY